ncbi:MAG TPA: FtsX-like permease family protein [Kofleriaceae bacterium]|jgi:putative ABC transport system permease protein|nr:FtsX-like permease family protein [Kofleriaceae bacterium]
MMTLKIAFRNILRNRRRSAMTVLAIAVGAIGVVLFGEFVRYITAGLETNTVERVGHLNVFRTGYFEFGAGNPAEYGIADFDATAKLIRDDPQLGPEVNVVTPVVSLAGIAGNFELDASKTFLGVGVVPSDRDRLERWDEHGVVTRRVLPESALRDDDETGGIVGVGMARVLGLCEPLKVARCPRRPTRPPPTGAPLADDLASVAASDLAAAKTEPAKTEPAINSPRLDLLAATAGGAPNVVSLRIARAEPQGLRELDDNFIAMHIALAQKLVYGRGAAKATALVVQLHRTEDLAAARDRLRALFAEHHLDLEVRDFAELQPFYTQAVGMFRAIFLFIALIMGVIVLFSIVNTMGMSVMERINEIGTARAMGVRRSGIRALFLAEGAMLGMIGATAGIALAQLLAALVNRASLTWTPPGQAAPSPLGVLTSESGPFIVVVWVAIVAAATFAALFPANRGARFEVVDALRHV